MLIVEGVACSDCHIPYGVWVVCGHDCMKELCVCVML